jgi:hypothetical protein
MPLTDFDGLLPALAWAFGETAVWSIPDGPDFPGGALVNIPGRFRIDPHEVHIAGPAPEGLNVTQTWFYCDQGQVPTFPVVPGQHDVLLIRASWWEIVQLDADDLGELGYRLLKAPAPPPPPLRAARAGRGHLA